MIDIDKPPQLAASKSVAYKFRNLVPTDGMALHKLVRACPPLDTNSSYCNLLQCSHFHDTSIAAFSGDDLAGSITAYRIPERPDTLFVWQVAVHPNARGQGLAGTMLRKLLERMSNSWVRFIETSITENNRASWRLFNGLAIEYNVPAQRSVMFDQTMHFLGQHDTEYLLRIGPFEAAAGTQEPRRNNNEDI